MRTVISQFLATLAFVMTGFAQTVLQNGSFEEIKDGKPTGWTTGHAWYEEPKGSGLAKVELDTVVFQGPGRQALRIAGTANRGIVQQQVNWRPEWGTRFRLSGWMRLQDTGHACSRIDVECIGADGKWLGSSAGLATDWRKSTADWECFAREFTIKPDTAALRVNCRTDRANDGTVWFDNVELEPLDRTESAKIQPPAEAPPVPVVAKVDTADAVEPLIPIDDFETGDSLWRGNAWAGAATPEFELRTDGAAEGNGYLRVTCPAAKNNMVQRTWNYEGDWDALTLRVRRVSGGGALTLYLSCGQVVFSGKWFQPGPEWTKIDVKAADFRYSWGAKDDKEKVFDRHKVTKLSFGHGEVIAFDLDQVALDLKEGLVLRTACTTRKGNLFAPGEQPDLRIEVLNAGTEPASAVIELETIPWGKDSGEVERFPVTLAPRSYQTVPQRLAALPLGYTSVHVRLLDTGRIVGTHSVGLCALPEPTKDSRTFMGASGFGMDRDRADIGKALGVQAAEIMVNWRTQEPTRGDFRLDGIGETLDTFETHGFTTTCMVMMSPERTPDWALPDGKRDNGGKAAFSRDTGAFAAFLEQIARRYGPRFATWSFCCEIDLLAHRLERGMDGYVDLVKAGSEAIRRVQPDAVVGGIGVTGADARSTPSFPVARKLWERMHDYQDGMFFDLYASPRYYGPGLRVVEPEENDLDGHLRDAVELVRQYGPGKRVAIEEKGWAIDSRLPVDAPEAVAMARCLCRSFLLARSVDEVEHYMWFQLDTGWDEGGYSYSLFRHEGDALNPRPAAASYAGVARLLAGATEPRRVDLHKDLYAIVFTHGQGARAALWTPLETPVRLLCELPEGTRITNMLDTSLTVEAGALTLTKEPLFLWGENVAREHLDEALSKGRFELPCVTLDVRLSRIDTVTVRARNLLNTDQTGEIVLRTPQDWTVSEPKREVRLTADGTATAEFRVRRNDPGTMPLRPGGFQACWTSPGHGGVNVESSPTVFPVVRLVQPPAVDGDLAEFASLPPIELDGQTYLDPPDAPSAKLWTGIDDLSATLRVAWDDACFYFAAQVRDDTFVQERTGSSIWANDSFQLAFDPDNDTTGAVFAGKSGYDEDDREFGIALTPQGVQTFQWAGTPDGVGRLVPECHLAVTREGDITRYEWAVPWTLVQSRKPQAGDILRFNAVVLDVDQKGKTARYWMGFTPGICGGKDPSVYHSFVLQ